MTFNIINNNMRVQNKIELQPSINYVSASSDCNFLDRLDIDNIDSLGNKVPGVYGAVNSSNINIRKDEGKVRLYTVNPTVFGEYKKDNGFNTLKAISEIKDEALSVSIDNVVDDLYSGVQGIGAVLLNLHKTATKEKLTKESYISKGVQQKNINNKEFGIERIKCEYLIDSPGYQKKKSVLNLFDFYKENIQYNNFYDLSWGFRNYNSLNFFNIDETINSNFSPNTTHKNCLIYPNMIRTLESNKLSYDFTNLEDFSISFYINPKRKNKTGYHYNPGCIINIPGVLSVFIVKGSNVDENQKTRSFRLLIQGGDSTFNSISTTITDGSFNLNDEASQSSDLNYLSKDNILDYNNWHNVCISYRKNNIANNNGYDFSIFIDGILNDEISTSSNINVDADSNGFVSVGNKPQVSSDTIADFVLHTFSKDLSELGDNNGPYVKKHIKFGSRFNTVLNTSSDPSNQYQFLNSLNADISAYTNEQTSLALNAELCDIRIYKTFIDEDKSKLICQSGVESIDKEIKDYKLIFYVPVYYFSQDVKKSGLVNLAAPYQVYYQDPAPPIGGLGNSVLGTIGENLSGSYFDSSNPPEAIDTDLIPEVTSGNFKVKTQNIVYNSPINPVFYNYTGGTDVSVEHFTREFVLGVQPNFTIGGSLQEDRYQDCFLAKKSLLLSSSSEGLDFNDFIKKGNSPDEFLSKIIENLTEDNLDDQNDDYINIDYQHNNILYRNYFVLPNDNGLQKQHYKEENFKYSGEDDLNIHKNNLGIVDLSYVSLDKIDSRFQSRKSIRQTMLLENSYLSGAEEGRSLFDIDNFVLQIISNAIDSVDGVDSKPSYREFPDRLKTISLSNFHNQVLSVYANDSDLAKIDKISRYKQEVAFDNNLPTYPVSDNLPLFQKSDFYRTLSNPAQRSVYSSHDNAISDSEIYAYKDLGNDSLLNFKKLSAPLWYLEDKNYENCSSIFALSTQLFNKEIKRETVHIQDQDLFLSCGLSMTFSDSRLGTLYRDDSLTKSAEWNSCGNILYKEGIFALRHPSAYMFGKTNLSFSAKSISSANVFELNLPAHAGETNESKNSSKIENLRLDESAFNSDEDFVYITDIDLHDENLNVVASVKLAQPFAKKESDNVLFRVKMDY